MKRAILCADLLGSVSLYGRLGDDEVEAVVANSLKRIQSQASAHGGKILETGGDELLVLFDTAHHAWLAASGMMQSVTEISTSAGKSPGLRIGLHLSLADEAIAPPTDQEIETAARITGLARSKEILCDSCFSGQLTGTEPRITARPDLNQLQQANSTIAICQLFQGSNQPPQAVTSPPRQAPRAGTEALKLRYRDNNFLLDPRTPALTIGRDLGNQLIIEDRKVSRRHARIERRSQGFYLVDTSTNGSFVTLAGQREILIRRDEIRLDGQGRICFGSSSNDPLANLLDFEPA